MADNNVIDSLELKVRSDANSAIANLGKLQTQLRHTAKSIGSVQSAVNSLNRVDISMKRLGQVNLGNLTKAVDQLERLSRIDFKNLDGRSINIDVKVNGADEVERMKYATEDALKKIDPNAFSKKFQQLFSIKGDAKKNINNQFKDMLDSIANNSAFDYKALWESVRENGAIARSAFDETVQGMKDEYQQFLDYVRQQPFKISADAYRSEWKDKTFDQGVGRFFEKAKNSGRILEADWQELTAKFPTLFSADDAAIANEEDQIDTIIAKIKEAQSVIDKKSISLFDQKDTGQIKRYYEGEFINSYSGMKDKFDSLVNENMKESAYKVPLDVAVDVQRIESQISNAIKEAAKAPRPLNIQFSVNTDSIKADIAKALSGIDASQMGELAEHLKGASQSIISMSSVDGAGVSKMVNAMNRLAKVDLASINATALGEIVESINKISQIGDISSRVASIVSALARLAQAGESTKTSAENLPMLGDNLKNLVDGIGSAGAIPDHINAFVSSISRLANAGEKANVTAGYLRTLGTAVKAFIDEVSGSSNVSDSILRMTEAIAQISNSGSKAGTAAKHIGKSINEMGVDSQKAHTRLSAIVSIMRDLLSVFQKAGNVVKQGALKIINSLKSIKKEGNGLQTATQSIKNMIGAMIGFRGITGLGNIVKQTVMLGADLTEIDHIVESVFGNMSSTVDQWAKDAIKNFGIAEHSAKRYAGVLSSMFQASNIGYMDAGKMSMDLVGLAGDLSAFYNIDTETAFNKIRSGMAGMVRPLRDLGIDLTAATLEEYRLAQGIQTSYSQMSQAEKVMLRYKYLMENTNLQQGDFVRTSGRSKRAA